MVLDAAFLQLIFLVCQEVFSGVFILAERFFAYTPHPSFEDCFIPFWGVGVCGGYNKFKLVGKPSRRSHHTSFYLKTGVDPTKICISSFSDFCC